MNAPADDPERWRSVKETARRFGVGRNKVYANCKSGAWPHHRTGTHVRAAIRFSAQDWREIDDLLRPTNSPVAIPSAPTVAQLQRGVRRRLKSSAA